VISAGSTVTVSTGEHAEAGDWAESVNLYEQMAVAEDENVKVGEAAPDIAVPHIPSEYH